ncbi:MAG: hypothetical protein DGJ47_000029 [Rickettsiaceae bacterium]
MDNKQKQRSLIIAFMATIVRYYDYALFGLSANILSHHFLMGEDSQQMLGFFTIFSLATIARPFGALIFGPIGDKMGRAYSIKIATILASISTISVAFIPGHEMFGYGSIVLLMLCRMVFLISLSGEVDAIKIFVTEIVGKNNKYIAISFVTFSSQIGAILASMLYHLAITQQGSEWLWRGNFIIGGVFGIIIILFRNNIHESEEFIIAKKNTQNLPSQNTWSIIADNKLNFCFATLISGILGSGYHFLIIFLGSFMAYTADVISYKSASLNNIVLIASYAISSIIAGYVSERTKHSALPIYAILTSCILLVLLMILGYKSGIWIHNLLIIIVPFYAVPGFVLMQQLFETHVRMRMCSLSHAVGSMLLSSSTPMICMLTWKYTESTNMVMSYFLIGLLVLAFIMMNNRPPLTMMAGAKGKSK